MDENFLQQYTDLLITQYYNKPKAKTEIEIIVGNSLVIYLFLKSFPKEFDIDNAWGDRLDILGKIVGINRIVLEGIAKKFFGWENGIALEPRTFDQAPMFDLFRDSDYTDTQLSDNQMRFYIKAKAIKNATSAYLSHGTRIDLQDAIQFLFKDRAIILDDYNMSMSIYIDDIISTEDIILLVKQNLLPKPQGVKLFLKKYYPGNTFGFANNPDAKTFGMGKFSELVTLPEN
jgi:hypothetical protein